MKTNHPKIITALAFLAAQTAPLAAATHTWNGSSSTSSNWSDAANWDTFPASASDTAITLAGTTRATIDLDTDFTLKTLGKTGATAFTINSTNGSTLSIYGDGANNAVTNSANGLLTINAAIKLHGTTRFATTSAAMKLGAIDLNGSNASFNANNDARSITLAGPVSGTASLVEFVGAGTYIIQSSNTYDAPTRLSNGTLKIQADNAFGNAGRQLNLGQTSTNGRTLTVLTEAAVSVQNTIVLAAAKEGGAAHTYTVGGNTAHLSSFKDIRIANDDQNLSLALTAAAGGRVNITGTITDLGTATGNGGLVKTGDGIVALNNTTATHTYKGDTAVNAGTLLVNGTLDASGGTVTVANKATLGGRGAIARQAVLGAGATLAPGNINADGASEIATLTFGAGLSLDEGALLAFDLGSSTTGNYDRIAVTGGDLVLDGTINFNALAGFGAGTYELLSFTGGAVTNNEVVPGAGLPDTGDYHYALNWDGATGRLTLVVTSTAIPEPAALAAVLGALILAASSIIRRR